MAAKTIQEEQLERMQIQRFRLSTNYVFYASLLRGQKLIIDDSTPNAYTNGQEVAFNSSWAVQLEDDHILFVLCHEILHLVFNHIVRFKTYQDKNKYEWSRLMDASNFLINGLLVREGIGKLPTHVPHDYDEKYTKEWDMIDIYHDLKKQEEDGTRQPKDTEEQGGFDSHKEWEDFEGDEDSVMKSIMQATSEADAMAKTKGMTSASDVPDCVRQMIGEFLKPQFSWEDAVQYKVSDTIKENKSWRRVDRRALNRGDYLQGKADSLTTKFCVAKDVSGSVGNEEIRVALSEIRGAIETLPNYEIYVMCFSDKVHSCIRLTENDTFDYEVHGTGGTNLSKITEYLEDNEIKVDSLFVITDGYTYEWPDEDYCDETTFLMTTDVIAPFGDTFKLKINS